MGRPRKRRRGEGDGEQDERLSDIGALGGGGGRHGEVLQTAPPYESGEMSLSDEFLMAEFPSDFSDTLAWPFPDRDMSRDPQRFFDESQYPTSAIDNPLPNTPIPSVLLDSQIAHTPPPPPIEIRYPHLSTPHSTGAASIPKCSCMPNLYTTLSSFQTLPAPSFPLTLSLLHNATTLARSVLHCRECIKTHVSAYQNIMLLCTLLTLVVHEYSRLLTHIEHRGNQEEKIPLRVGEPVRSAETMHLHTGRADCPMGYNILLDGAEWSKMAREAVRDAVQGKNEDGSVAKLLEELIQRQNEWHTCLEAERRTRGLPPSTECINLHNDGSGGGGGEKGEYNCLQMIGHIKRSVQRLGLGL